MDRTKYDLGFALLLALLGAAIVFVLRPYAERFPAASPSDKQYLSVSRRRLMKGAKNNI
jgi:hypothetical protein